MGSSDLGRLRALLRAGGGGGGGGTGYGAVSFLQEEEEGI